MVEKKIDLVELFIHVYKKRKFIMLLVSFFTLIAVIYSYTRTPIYEASAVVKFGDYFKYKEQKIKIITVDNKTRIDTNFDSTNITESFFINNNQLIKEIKFNYLNKKLNNGRIVYIRKDTKIEDYFHIKAHSLSPQDSLVTIKTMINNINKELNDNENFLLSRKKERNNRLKNEIYLIKEKIDGLKRTIQIFEKENRNLDIIGEYNFSLLMEKYYNSKIKLNKLEENKIINEKDLIELSDRNIKLVNDIVVNNKAIKPNKFKIILMTMISSLFLSLFLLPFLNIIKIRAFK